MKDPALEMLSTYVQALRPIIYINHFDFVAVDQMLREISDSEVILEYNNALGMIDFKTKRQLVSYTLEQFLASRMDDGFDEDGVFLVLKDVHRELKEPAVIALLKRIAERQLSMDGEYQATVFIVSSELVIPPELENYITVFDIPLPDEEKIKQIILEFAGTEDVEITIPEEDLGELSLSLKGMNEFQIRQVLLLAYVDGGTIDAKDRTLILQEKEQIIKKAGMLELVNFSERIDDIGGLENLKAWLKNKAKVFNRLDKARSFGVDLPKGVLIVGMPGCGKSLTAKATASLFQIPLVRLDVGRLLGKYVGESEKNMRRALRLAEAISPCVLWVDEIEKAFSGVGEGSGSSDVTTRLFGQFLTWMQEKENTVFIVATANNVSKLPPEFLRKGRFDELFSVDLPNAEERKKILQIHLEKRRPCKKFPTDRIDVNKLVSMTEGYSGADLEGIVKDALENAFVNGKTSITTDDVVNVIQTAKPISKKNPN